MIARCLLAAAALAACVPDAPPSAPPHDEWDDKLAERVVDYNAALRIAALRLTGDLPTMAEINAVATAPDDATQKRAYEARSSTYMDRPGVRAPDVPRSGATRFKHGRRPRRSTPRPRSPRSSPSTTARTSSCSPRRSGTCPTFDRDARARSPPANCTNGRPATAGVLTQPGRA